MAGARLVAAMLVLPGLNASAQSQPVDVAGALRAGRAAVTSSAIDIGSVHHLFDGDTGSLARSAAVNPMQVTLAFDSPVVIARTRIWFLAGPHRWRMETADTPADLDGQTGSYRVALDWATDDDWAWRDRLLVEPVTCRVMRLQLERLTGDDYVHFNAWQLFREDVPFKLTAIGHALGSLELTWNAEPGQWYEVLRSPANPVGWSGEGFHQSQGARTTHIYEAPLPEAAWFAVREAKAEERPSITRRVLVVNIDPVLESHGGQRLNAFLGWNDPRELTTHYLADLEAAAGGYVTWEIAEWVDLDLWPRKADGFSYDDQTYLQSWNDPQQYPWHHPDAVDYDALLDYPLSAPAGRTAHRLAADGEVDEVIYWAHPYAGFFESRMVGSTAYWCNAPALTRSSRLYVVMGLNPERGVGEALHSFGHRCESILRHVYGSWSASAAIDHLWDRFTRVGPVHGVGVAGCGNVHFPPNAGQDYAYAVEAPVLSEADAWLTFPDLSGPTHNIGRTAWGGPDYQRNYLNWWMARFPRAPGRYDDPGNPANHQKLNNWWAYLVDMNEYPESR
jgi:hypothetical protein